MIHLPGWRLEIPKRNIAVASNKCRVTVKDIMADGDRDIFVYRGVQAPRNVTHVRIDKSVEVIEEHAFFNCEHLVQVETHDGIRKVGSWAFYNCRSLRSINLRSVLEIGDAAFHGCNSLGRIDLRSAVEIGEAAFQTCENLVDVKFGDKLETIGNSAFSKCTFLERLKLSSIIAVEANAFKSCKALTSIELSERLETIELCAFRYCDRLQRIAIPLKRDLFLSDWRYLLNCQFDDCDQLTTVDLVGGVHNKIIASLHMESWRIEMIAEINRINQVLPNTPAHVKTAAIKQWMDSVIDKIDHYKAEHHGYVKEAVTLLELALWKAKLDEKDENGAAAGRTKTANIIDAESARKEKRVTCGADTVIRNVIPFLQLQECADHVPVNLPRVAVIHV
jgi:hypothetical protein